MDDDSISSAIIQSSNMELRKGQAHQPFPTVPGDLKFDDVNVFLWSQYGALILEDKELEGHLTDPPMDAKDPKYHIWKSALGSLEI